MKTTYPWRFVVLILTALLVLAACGNDDAAVEAGSTSETPSEAEEEPAVVEEEPAVVEEEPAVVEEEPAVVEEEPAVVEEAIKVGFVTHVKGNPFIQSIVDAAQDAADDLGIELVVGGTTEFDAEQQLAIINDMFASGVDGVVTSVPGDSMAVEINRLIAEGKPIVQFNVFSERIEGMYVGEKTPAAWTQLGEKLGEKAGGSAATGSALVGTCFPGLGVLEARAAGVIAGIQNAAPGLDIVGPFDVKVDSVVNFSNWQQQAAANEDAVILAGLCAPDLESLGKVNAENDNRYVTGGSDPTEGNLAAIKEGTAFMTVGQTGYVQGYLPVKIIVDSIREGVTLSQGFVPSGAEFITADGVEEPYGLPSLTLDELIEISADPALAKEYYAALFVDGGELDDWQSKVEPIENASN